MGCFLFFYRIERIIVERFGDWISFAVGGEWRGICLILVGFERFSSEGFMVL